MQGNEIEKLYRKIEVVVSTYAGHSTRQRANAFRIRNNANNLKTSNLK